MNWDRAKGNWKQFRGKVQEQWGRLSDDQLDVIAGRREMLLGKIQECYGVSKDQAERQIKEWEDRTFRVWDVDDAVARPKNRANRMR